MSQTKKWGDEDFWGLGYDYDPQWLLTDKQKDAILGTIPSGKLGTGADVAAAVAYLASREAGYVTGQTLHVNGGMAMI